MAVVRNNLAAIFFCFFSINFVSHFAALAQPQVPCYFVFGDSLADPGNNNDLKTFAKANYAPYGVDFPGGANPTGRFTNGRTYVDFIAESLGFTSFIPPISGRSDPNFIGVNYASGAAGILDDTGRTNGDRIPLSKQILAHKDTVDQLHTIRNWTADDVLSLLNKCIYTIGIGSNDYVNNYFLPQLNYTAMADYDPPAFAKMLVSEHNRMIKELHALGARKMAFVGVGHIGYTPLEFKILWPGAENATKLNDAVDLFNAELKASVDALGKTLLEAKLTYLNTVGIASGGPSPSLDDMKACCNIDPASGVSCVKDDASICPDRSKALFFDNIHPTEAVNAGVSARYYTAKDPSDASPYDIASLAAL